MPTADADAPVRQAEAPKQPRRPRAAFFDGAVTIDGRPTIVFGADLHYFRVRDRGGDPSKTHRMWAESLDAMVDAGMNTVATYVPWDHHALAEGRFDFSGTRDLRKFLELAKDRNLHVVLKPGPSITGEWPRGFGTFGAIPEWFKAANPDLLERSADGSQWTFSPLGDPRAAQPAYLDEQFLEAVDGWYERFLEEVDPYLGETVVALQIDNETNVYWGDPFEGPGRHPTTLAWYRKHLADRYGDVASLNRAYGTAYSSFDEVVPPDRRPTRTTDAPPAPYADWYAALESMIVEYLSRLRSMLEARGADEKAMLFVNDAPFSVHQGDRLISHAMLPSASKSAVAHRAVDLYPKFDFDPRTPQSEPFQTDFFVRLFELLNGGDGGVLGAELQAGLFSMFGALRMPVSPASTDLLLARAFGRGLAGGALYVMQDGLNADDSRYDYAAPLKQNGASTARYDVVRRWGGFLKRVGADLATAKSVTHPIGILVDPTLAVPRPKTERDAQLSKTLDEPALFGWLAAAGFDPTLIDARTATEEDLERFGLVFTLNPDDTASRTRRLIDAQRRRAHHVGVARSEPADLSLFAHGRYHLASAEEIAEATSIAKRYAARAGITPFVEVDDRTVATVRRSEQTRYIFLTRDGGRAADVPVRCTDLDALGLDAQKSYRVVEGLSNRELGVFTGAELRAGAVSVHLGRFGTAALTIREREAPPLEATPTGAIGGLARDRIQDPASASHLYRLTRAGTENAIGLDELGRVLGNPTNGRRVARRAVSELRSRLGLWMPESFVPPLLEAGASQLGHLSITPSQIRAGFDAATFLERTGLLEQDEFRPDVLPHLFDTKHLESAPIDVPRASLEEIAPGVLSGGEPTEASETARRANAAFAAALNGLVEGDRMIVHDGQRYGEVGAFLAALMADGHDVEAKIVQRVANFVPLMVRGPRGESLDVPMPVFVDTGLTAADGTHLSLPAPHAEWVFSVRPTDRTKGTRVQADVTWFLGTGAAAAFWADDVWKLRPWQGHSVPLALQGDQAIEAAALAATLGDVLNTTARERRLFGGGYGILGVCQDSVALVEAVLTGDTNLFPLLMDHELVASALEQRSDAASPRERERLEALRTALAALPVDNAVGATTAKRVLASIPFAEGAEPFEVHRRIRHALADAPKRPPLSGPAAWLSSAVEALTTAAALTPAQIADAFDASRRLNAFGLLPGAPEIDNGVYRLDAVQDKNLPRRVDDANFVDHVGTPRAPKLEPVAPGLFAGYRVHPASAKAKRRNTALAEAFDRLASNPERTERFELSRNGVVYDRLDRYLEALRADGHEVRVSIEAHAAHVTGLHVPSGDGSLVEVPTPITIRTGTEANDVPAVHAALRIEVRPGPDIRGASVEGDVVWYTGLRGTHFYPADLYAEPSWAGGRTLDVFEDDEAVEAVCLAGLFGEALNAAAERESLWLNGYGVLGVCNDAVAAVEHTLRRRTTLYPLIMDRDAVLKALARRRSTTVRVDRARNSRLYGAVLQLPIDTEPTPTTLTRVRSSSPYAPQRIFEERSGPTVPPTRAPPRDAFAGAVDRWWQAVDANGDGRIDESEVRGYLKRQGLDGFLLGALAAQGAKAMIERMDEDSDGVVTKAELLAHPELLAFPPLVDADGVWLEDGVDRFFEEVANGGDEASADELERHFAASIPLGPLAGSVAKVAARTLLDFIVGERATTLPRDVLEEFVEAVASRAPPAQAQTT